MWYLIIIFRIIEEIESISFSRIFELLNYCYANTKFCRRAKIYAFRKPNSGTVPVRVGKLFEI